ncbi:unnamed protein product [Calypogeia fissa]
MMSLVSCSESESEDTHIDPAFDLFEVTQTGDEERMFQLISCKYDGPSLFVEIQNNMAGASLGRTATIISDCYAYSNGGQLLSSLGAGTIQPAAATVYWMNLKFFIPSIGTVSCNVTAPAGNSRTLTMYDDNNMELSYLTIQWSIDERGFSLYNPVSDKFDLYETW